MASPSQPFKLQSAGGSDAHITLHLQLHFTKKIFGRKRVLTSDSDNMSVLSLGAEASPECRSPKNMSLTSGISGSIAETETVTLSEIGQLELITT